MTNATCSGSNYTCPSGLLSNTSICYRGTELCEQPTTYCNGVNSACNVALKPNGTICAAATMCPRQQNRVCTGSSRFCPELTQCNCVAGEFGRDCSCRSPGPSMVAASCLRGSWQTVADVSMIIASGTMLDLSNLKNDSLVVNGDLWLDETTSIKVGIASSINVTGDVSLDGTLILDVTVIPNFRSFFSNSSNLYIWKLSLASNDDQSVFESIEYFGLPDLSCRIPITTENYSRNKTILTVTVGYIDDPNCKILCTPPIPPGAACYGGIYTINSNVTIPGGTLNLTTDTRVNGSFRLQTDQPILSIGDSGSVSISGCFSPSGLLEIHLPVLNMTQNMSDTTARIDFDEGYCDGIETNFANISVVLAPENSCAKEQHDVSYGERTIAVVYTFDTAGCATVGDQTSSPLVLTIGAIVGIVVAAVVVVSIILASVYILWCRNKVHPWQRTDRRHSNVATLQ